MPRGTGPRAISRSASSFISLLNNPCEALSCIASGEIVPEASGEVVGDAVSDQKRLRGENTQLLAAITASAGHSCCLFQAASRDGNNSCASITVPCQTKSTNSDFQLFPSNGRKNISRNSRQISSRETPL